MDDIEDRYITLTEAEAALAAAIPIEEQCERCYWKRRTAVIWAEDMGGKCADQQVCEDCHRAFYWEE